VPSLPSELFDVVEVSGVGELVEVHRIAVRRVEEPADKTAAGFMG
jgi:hypothetical protein